MAENNSGNSGKENGPKQSGLSWSQPSSKAGTIGSTTSAPKSSPLLKPAAPMRPQTNTMSGRKLALFFAGGLVVGGLLSWSLFSMTADNSGREEGGTMDTTGTSATGTQGTATLPGATISNETLVVPSPQDAGLSVSVSSATVNVPTWVVVYESKGNMRGNALGAALFFPEGGDRTINLLRATQPGSTYFVGRHIDNGDKQFSLVLDKPMVNAAGNPVYVELRTR